MLLRDLRKEGLARVRVGREHVPVGDVKRAGERQGHQHDGKRDEGAGLTPGAEEVGAGHCVTPL